MFPRRLLAPLTSFIEDRCLIVPTLILSCVQRDTDYTVENFLQTLLRFRGTLQDHLPAQLLAQRLRGLARHQALALGFQFRQGRRVCSQVSLATNQDERREFAPLSTSSDLRQPSGWRKDCGVMLVSDRLR